jgi:hypothetical protein
LKKRRRWYDACDQKFHERKSRTMSTLFNLVTTIQQVLFPALEKELATPLGEKGELFVTVVELSQPEQFIERFEWQGLGCPRKWRLPILLSLIAKAVWNLPTTRALLDRLVHDPTLRRLCGWEKAAEVVSESTFSRAFAEFAGCELPQLIHAAMVKAQLGEKLVGHISRDAMAIEGREKAVPKPPPVAKPKRRRGRPRKDDPPRPKPEPTRLELQGGRSVGENLADLPRVCDSGGKKNSKGFNQYWRGYKLHIDAADGEIPVSAILTSASLHDSQVAIPLAQLTMQRVVNLYDLMDKAYDAEPIAAYSRRLGHVPIIEPKARAGKPAAEMEPARRLRYGERTTVERVNSDLKDNHGGTTIRVRGAAKVMAHLMLGLIVVTAKGLCRLLE